MTKICAAEGCVKVVKARGLCSAHYMQRLRDSPDTFPIRKRGAVLEYIHRIAGGCDTDECVPWPFSSVGGYGRVSVGGRLTVASRLVCELVHGPPPTDKHQAAHICGKGHLGCINPRHLRWASQSENQMDRHAHGSALVGERALVAKLSEADVRAIRAHVGGGLKDIAARFAVSYQHVWAIRAGKYWKHVDGPRPA